MNPTSSPKDLLHTLTAVDLQTDLAKAALPVVLANLRVLDRKQQDYGSANLTKFGVYGVIVRANDKLERIVNLEARARQGKAAGHITEALNEPLADSFLDLANYAIIAYLMHTQRWPNDILGKERT